MSRSLWEWLRGRAVEVHVADHLCERLQRGEKLRVKLGVDPTAPDLHVGHLVVFDVLRAFQREGHTPVLIVGDYTARIGDPSGRSEPRPVLSSEQVEANARTYFEQAFRILDRERTEVHGNSEWLATMDAADILRLLGTQTLQAVLQREDFATRLKHGYAAGAHGVLMPVHQGHGPGPTSRSGAPTSSSTCSSGVRSSARTGRSRRTSPSSRCWRDSTGLRR